MRSVQRSQDGAEGPWRLEEEPQESESDDDARHGGGQPADEVERATSSEARSDDHIRDQREQDHRRDRRRSRDDQRVLQGGDELRVADDGPCCPSIDWF